MKTKQTPSDRVRFLAVAGLVAGLYTALTVVLAVSLAVGWLSWKASQVGLVEMGGASESGWDSVFPLLGRFVILLAVARFLLRRPALTAGHAVDHRTELRPEDQY